MLASSPARKLGQPPIASFLLHKPKLEHAPVYRTGKKEKQTDEHGTTHATRERDHSQVPTIRSPTARQVPHKTCALRCKGTTHRNSHGQLAPDEERHAKRSSLHISPRP